MIKQQFGLFALAALFVLTLAAAPAQAVGPQCPSTCFPWGSCNTFCYDGLFPTFCGEWTGAPCGVCVPSTTWSGTSGPDTYSGTSANEWIDGWGGGDSLFGAAGNDRISGGDGDDFVYGGFGTDCLYGDSGYDYASGDYGSDICDAESEVSCND